MTAPEQCRTEAVTTLGAGMGGIALELWPRRKQQELLFDLGERKAWTPDDRRQSVACVADWLTEALDLRPWLREPHGGPESKSDEFALKHIQALGPTLTSVSHAVGVSRWACGASRALGMAPKALANSVSRGLRSSIGAHRWIRVIGRLVGGHEEHDAWVFHRRSPQAVTAALEGMITRSAHAADAVLVLGLVALWQRRRPTVEARGNRGRTSTRRAVPKPVAALSGSLCQPAQVAGLFEVAGLLRGRAREALAGLAIEAALTEAHLCPHAARAGQVGDERKPGEAWLGAVEQGMLGTPNLVAEIDAQVVGFRIARMRAWREGRAQLPPSPEIATHPYVAASMALERTRSTSSAQGQVFHSGQPGLLMLLPALRARGFVQDA